MATRRVSHNKPNLTISRMSTALRYAGNLTIMLLLSTMINGAITEEQRESFQRDGFLYMPDYFSLFPNDSALLKHLLRAGDDLLRRSPPMDANRTFSTCDPGVLFGTKDELYNVESNGECENERSALQDIVYGFRNVALRSSLVDTVAELMRLDPNSQNLRVLRDVFLAKPIQNETICDWHVDDQLFWPEAFTSGLDQPADGLYYQSSGINVWIAMDDMPAKYGGSMAVSPGSHLASWRHDAYRAIGQNRSNDVNPSKEEIFEVFSGGPPKNNSCNMNASDPELRKSIEATKVVFDIRKGDVLFADRLLFHRTLEMSEEGRKFFGNISKDAFKRYSIRYVPGSARLPSGFNVEACILSNAKNEGRSLNEVADNVDNGGAVWYPQVWPTLDEDVDTKLDHMGSTLYKQGRALQSSVMAEIFGSFRTAAAQTTVQTDGPPALKL